MSAPLERTSGACVLILPVLVGECRNIPPRVRVELLLLFSSQPADPNLNPSRSLILEFYIGFLRIFHQLFLLAGAAVL